MSASRVQVLTLAELAFTVLFAVIIVSLPQANQAAQVREEREAMRKERDRLASELADEKMKNSSLAALVANAPGKLSNIPPRCNVDPLERVTILGSDQFEIRGELVNARFISSRHASDIAWADGHKCHHRVVVNWSDSLSASDLASAMQRLERNFYILRAGSVAAH